MAYGPSVRCRRLYGHPWSLATKWNPGFSLVSVDRLLPQGNYPDLSNVGDGNVMSCDVLTSSHFNSIWMHYYHAQNIAVSNVQVIKVLIYGSQIQTLERCSHNHGAMSILIPVLQMTTSSNSHIPALYSKACTMENATMLNNTFKEISVYEFSCACLFSNCDRLNLFIGKPNYQIKICEIVIYSKT